jgi:hypothetical protein
VIAVTTVGSTVEEPAEAAPSGSGTA